MSRIQVQIVRETPKALLIAANGHEGWIQRRWLAADSTVSVSTFNKAAAKSAARRADNTSIRAWKDAYHPVAVVGETEKAVLCNASMEIYIAASSMARGHKEGVWFPKSLLRDGAAPGWLLLKKSAELMKNWNALHQGGCSVDSIGGVSLMILPSQPVTINW